MRNDFLRGLQARYGSKGGGHHSVPIDPLESLLAKYREFRSTTTIDGAAAAAALSIDQFKEGHVDPLAEKAIHATNPDFNPWEWHSDAEWQATISSAKGKYFEYWVADQLNHGHSVGDVALPSGYKAVVAESMNQPGWDLRILDDQGHVSDYLQLKATTSTAYIHDALTRYPDIKILATSDVAGHLGDHHMVLDAALTEDSLRDVVNVTLDHSDSLLGHFWDHFHPAIPLMVVGGMHGYKVAMGTQTIADAMELAGARAQRALVATSVGAIAKVVGLGWFSIPAALLAGYWVTSQQSIDELVSFFRERNTRLRLQADSYRLRYHPT